MSRLEPVGSNIFWTWTRILITLLIFSRNIFLCLHLVITQEIRISSFPLICIHTVSEGVGMDEDGAVRLKLYPHPSTPALLISNFLWVLFIQIRKQISAFLIVSVDFFLKNQKSAICHDLSVSVLARLIHLLGNLDDNFLYNQVIIEVHSIRKFCAQTRTLSDSDLPDGLQYRFSFSNYGSFSKYSILPETIRMNFQVMYACNSILSFQEYF